MLTKVLFSLLFCCVAAEDSLDVMLGEHLTLDDMLDESLFVADQDWAPFRPEQSTLLEAAKGKENCPDDDGVCGRPWDHHRLTGRWVQFGSPVPIRRTKCKAIQVNTCHFVGVIFSALFEAGVGAAGGPIAAKANWVLAIIVIVGPCFIDFIVRTCVKVAEEGLAAVAAAFMDPTLIVCIVCKLCQFLLPDAMCAAFGIGRLEDTANLFYNEILAAIQGGKSSALETKALAALEKKQGKIAKIKSCFSSGWGVTNIRRGDVRAPACAGIAGSVMALTSIELAEDEIEEGGDSEVSENGEEPRERGSLGCGKLKEGAGILTKILDVFGKILSCISCLAGAVGGPVRGIMKVVTLPNTIATAICCLTKTCDCQHQFTTCKSDSDFWKKTLEWIAKPLPNQVAGGTGVGPVLKLTK